MRFLLLLFEIDNLMLGLLLLLLEIRDDCLALLYFTSEFGRLSLRLLRLLSFARSLDHIRKGFVLQRPAQIPQLSVELLLLNLELTFLFCLRLVSGNLTLRRSLQLCVLSKQLLDSFCLSINNFLHFFQFSSFLDLKFLKLLLHYL